MSNEEGGKKWYQIEGTFEQVDNEVGGVEYEKRAKTAREEVKRFHAEAEQEVKLPQVGIAETIQATHRVPKNQPVVCEDDHRRAFTDNSIPVVRISGGKGKGPVKYRALKEFDTHFDTYHRHHPAGVKLQAPRAYPIRRTAQS